MSKSHPVAYADESFIVQKGHPGAYIFSAVIIDQDDLGDVIRAAREAAGPYDSFHTHVVHWRGHANLVEDMLDVVEGHAGWTSVSVKAPVGGETPSAKEVARQQTLAHLLRQLNAQRVRDVILDTQASAREQNQTRHEGRKITRSDLPERLVRKVMSVCD